MIPYGKQQIDETDVKAVSSVLKADFLTQGPEVAIFEESIKKITGAKYAVAVSSGTAALHVAYLAAGLSAGDEVITTPNTFVATTNMLLATGAVPVFCDISLETHNIDETKIESLITPKTKAVVAVDFSGRPCNYDAVRTIASKNNLLLISDSAHSLGATYKGLPIGTLADITTFSFHPVKPITTAEGGAVLTDKSEIYERAKLFRSHGIHKNEKGINVMTELGYNYRLPDVLATLGTSQIKKLDKFISYRQEVASWYQTYLEEIDDIYTPLPSEESGWHIYVIRVKDKSRRMPLAKYLLDKGINVNFHYPSVYGHPYYRQHGYADINLPNMHEYEETCLTLPCYVGLKEDEVKTIANYIKDFLHE